LEVVGTKDLFESYNEYIGRHENNLTINLTKGFFIGFEIKFILYLQSEN